MWLEVKENNVAGEATQYLLIERSFASDTQANIRPVES